MVDEARSVPGVDIDDSAAVVDLEFDLGVAEFEVGVFVVAHSPLDLLDLVRVEGAVDGLPKACVSHMRLDVLLAGLLVLSGVRGTMSISMRYSLLILACWRWGVTE